MSSAEGANQRAYAASSEGRKKKNNGSRLSDNVACNARLRAAQSPSESQYEKLRHTGSL